MADDDIGDTGAPWYSSIKGWLILAAVTVVFFVGWRIPLPGVDRDALAMFPESDVASIFMLNVWVLLIVRLGTMLIIPAGIADQTARVLHKLGLVLYLGISAVQGAAIAFSLEQMVFGFQSLVLQPGWSFKIITVTTFCAVAALFWWMADRISSTNLVNGALWLYALSAASGSLNLLLSPSWYWEPHYEPTIIALMIFLPLAVVAIGLSFFLVDWPQPVARQLVAFSPLDLLCLPFIGWNITIAVTPLLFLLHFNNGLVLTLQLMAATGIAFFAVAWLYFKQQGRGSLAWIGLALVTMVPPLGTVGIWGFLTIGDSMEPGPLDGPAEVELILAPDEGVDANDVAMAIEERLEEYRVQGEISVEGTEVRALLHQVDPAKATEAIGFPKRLTMHIEKSMHPQQNMEEALSWGATLDEDWAIDCSKDTPCVAYLLEPAVIFPGDIAQASASYNQYQEPMVHLKLTADGTERFCVVSRDHVRQKLVIVVDGEAVVAPVIREPICGGAVVIEFGASENPLQEATILAGALNSATEATWTLKQTNTF